MNYYTVLPKVLVERPHSHLHMPGVLGCDCQQVFSDLIGPRHQTLVDASSTCLQYSVTYYYQLQSFLFAMSGLVGYDSSDGEEDIQTKNASEQKVSIYVCYTQTLHLDLLTL